MNLRDAARLRVAVTGTQWGEAASICNEGRRGPVEAVLHVARLRARADGLGWVEADGVRGRHSVAADADLATPDPVRARARRGGIGRGDGRTLLHDHAGGEAGSVVRAGHQRPYRDRHAAPA